MMKKDWFEERLINQFFIDQYGEIHKCKKTLKEVREAPSIHWVISNDIFPNEEYPTDYVMKKLGWVCVGSSVYNAPIMEKMPTQSQIDTLFDIGLLDKLLIKVNNQYIPHKNLNYE